MKKFIMILMALFVMASISTVVVSAADPAMNYTAPAISTAPVIDGNPSDSVWNSAEWTEITGALQLGAVSGNISAPKFKVLHDGTYIYLYIEVADVAYYEWNSTTIAFSDVRSDQKGPNSSFYFRTATADGIELTAGQGANREESENSTTLEEYKGVISANGSYCIEAKFKWSGFTSNDSSVYFQIQVTDSEGSYLLWNYTTWQQIGNHTHDYGVVTFAEGQSGANPGTFDIVLTFVAVATVSGMGIVASKKTRR